MNWFKKLSIEKHENQNKKKFIIKKNLKKNVKNLNNNNKIMTSRIMTKKGLSLSCPQLQETTGTGNISCETCDNELLKDEPKKKINFNISIDKFEIIDPEDFFQDPEHVQNYREEANFLQILRDWEIIENPINICNNYFSSNFEDEFVASRSQTNLTEISYISDIDKLSKLSLENFSTECSTRSLLSHLFGYKIENGLIWKENMKENAKIKLKNELKKAIVMKCRKYSQSTENFIKESSKTEALSGSIMGSIGKCPGKDLEKKFSNSTMKLQTELNDENEKYIIDHFDIQQYFRLDDNGNILLNFDHIQEEKGYGFLMRRTKRFYRNICKGQIIDESYVTRKSLIHYFKNIFKWFEKVLTGHPRNKPLILGGPGDTVRSYTLQLAKDETSTFARNIENFISCTKESREAAPQVVMRNMRQFMNGMKNYLVKHGEADFHREVEKARSRLKSDEFLNLDSLLETVMHQLVVLPLREHLYGMFVDYYTRSSDIQLLAENVKYACARNPAEFGIRSTVNPPSSIALQQISTLLLRLQEAELPLEKLDLFLCIISAIFDSTGCSRGQQLGADDFLPILVYVVAKCGFVGAEIEAEFMWGLLQPALLNGEAGYYLTALCSAVHVLKCFMASDTEGNGSLDWRSSSMPACSSVLRVIIPDECNGSLQTRTLPVRPHTTTREVCRIIAHKARITNPQDYGLFKLVDGEETILTDIECPQDARLAARGKHCMLAYKRIDAKIAWPTHTSS